ncbi:MAG: hypothetical protein PF489_11410 [Salinivirgaceae bacterium]|nr:hypothetical protein [Salinivirgaceae bacterium]
MNSQARFPMPYGYGFIPFVYPKRMGESAGLPRSALITANVGMVSYQGYGTVEVYINRSNLHY